MLGLDFTCTKEFKEQIILLHRGKLTKAQQQIKDSVTRNEVEPPLNRGSRILQPLEEKCRQKS